MWNKPVKSVGEYMDGSNDQSPKFPPSQALPTNEE